MFYEALVETTLPTQKMVVVDRFAYVVKPVLNDCLLEKQMLFLAGFVCCLGIYGKLGFLFSVLEMPWHSQNVTCT